MSSSELLKFVVYKRLILNSDKNFKLTNCKNNKCYYKNYKIQSFLNFKRHRMRGNKIEVNWVDIESKQLIAPIPINIYII